MSALVSTPEQWEYEGMMRYGPWLRLRREERGLTQAGMDDGEPAPAQAGPGAGDLQEPARAGSSGKEAERCAENGEIGGSGGVRRTWPLGCIYQGYVQIRAK